VSRPLAEPLLTTMEVAAIFRVARNTAARWADEGLIPSFKTPGGQRRFRKSEVLAVLESGVPNTAPDATEPAEAAS